MPPNESTGLLEKTSADTLKTSIPDLLSLVKKISSSSLKNMVLEVRVDAASREVSDGNSSISYERLHGHEVLELSFGDDALSPVEIGSEGTQNESIDSEDDTLMEPRVSTEKLGMLPLAILVFYNVSGGPFGIETSVRAGGNFFALLGFLILPFVWSLQEALITAELGTAFPEASGGVAWVEEAFGSTAGWMSGYLGWIAGATDNAIYPVLFLDYLLAVVHRDEDEINPVIRFLFLSSSSIVLAYINWRGLALVGNMSMWICLISMSPFFIMIVMGAPKVDTARWFYVQRDEIDSIISDTDDDISGGIFPNAEWGGILWRPYLNNLFWNLNSFDAAASFVAEVENSRTVFPAGMLWGVFFVVVGYFFPLLIAVGATDYDREQWTDGFLAQVAADIGGAWLGGATVFAAAISNIALFQAELSADAFQLMGMADRGHVPKIFSKRSRHGTPTNGIILGVAVIVVMGTSDFDQLIEMLNFNYSISLLLEYCAFIKLRINRSHIERPYRIPLGVLGCTILLTPTVVVTCLVLALATYKTYLFALGTNMFGLLVYYGKTRSTQNVQEQEDHHHIVSESKAGNSEGATLESLQEL